MKRLLVILVIALLAAGCTDGDSAIDPSALRAGDTTVSVNQLDDEMSWFADNPDAADRLFGGPPDPTNPAGPASVDLTGDAPGSWSPVVTAQLLSLHAQAVLVDAVLDDLGAEITDEDLADARVTLASVLAPMNPITGQPDESFIDSVPDSLADPITRLIAAEPVSRRTVERSDVADISDEEVRTRYDEAVELFEQQQETEGAGGAQRCASHILFAFDAEALGEAEDPTDEQDAAALDAAESTAAELAEGADFSALASERSDDTGSAVEGGELGCGPPGQYVPEFEAALDALDEGEVSEPVRTQFGYHIIRRNAIIPPFDDIAGELRIEMATEAVQEAVGEAYTRASEEIEVQVDPRFGTWDASTGTVVPPEGSAPPPAPVDSQMDFDQMDFDQLDFDELDLDELDLDQLDPAPAEGP